MKIGKLRLNMIENPAFVDEANRFANVGDSVQSVITNYIFEKIGLSDKDVVKVDRSKLKTYIGEELFLPLHIAFTKSNINEFLPISQYIKPFFISIVLYEDIFEERADLIDYFKKYEPIGCRDEQTYAFFDKYGIEAYIMGCFTVCLPDRKKSGIIGDKTFLIDASEELMKILPKDICCDAIKMSHATVYKTYPITHAEDERMDELASQYLKKYYNEAKLVITSRLHVAAPCLGMGIPVILASDDADFRYGWVDRWIPVYQLNDYWKIDYTKSMSDLNNIRELLLSFFQNSILHFNPDKATLKRIHDIYTDKKRFCFNQKLRNELFKLKEKENNIYGMKYAIWGAGMHAIYVYNLMREMYPNAQLLIVVDKYKKGTLFGVPIITGDKLEKYDVDHVCITTNPGLNEALDACRKLWGKDSKNYSILTSQQKS